MSKALKIVIWIVVIVLVAWGIYALSTQGKFSENNPVKVGVVGHFSGDFANYGIPMKNAVQLAVENQNEVPIELIIEDDNSDQADAVSSVNKLINIDDVDYVISAQGSGATSAIAPTVNSSERILMVTLGSAPDIAKTGEYIFRSVPSDNYQSEKMVEFLKNELGSKSIAGLYVNDAYGIGIRDFVEDNVDSIVASELFESGSSDVRTQLLKIKNSGADSMVLVSRNETPQIMKQIEELGIKMNIIASETTKDDNILSSAGKSMEGIFVAFMDEPEDFVDFSQMYLEKFGEEPSAYGRYAYDGAVALIKAIKNSNDDVLGAKSFLAKTNFKGASGDVSFDDNGDRTGIGYVIYTVKDGKFVLYKN